MQLYAAKHSFDLTPSLVQGFFRLGGRLGVVPLQREGYAEGGSHPAVLPQGHADAPDAPGALLTLVAKPLARISASWSARSESR